MAEIRLVRPEEIEEAIHLANETFRDDDQISMGKAFPQVFSASLGQSFGAFEGGRLVSFTGLFPSIIRIGSARLKVFSLGPVCTDESHRGKGLAGAVLEKVTQHIDQAGASLLLVSGRRSLYTRNHCCLFGSGMVSKYTLYASSVNSILQKCHTLNIRIRELLPEDWLGLREVTAKRTVCYEQSVWDLAQLIQAGGVASNFKLKHKVLVAEKDEGLAGFTVVGVPYGSVPERPPLVIERGGKPDVSAVLIAHALEKYKLEKLTVNVGWHEKELMKILNPVEYEHEQYSGTVKVVNSERLIHQLRPYFVEKNAGTIEQLSVRQLKDSYTEIMLSNGKTFRLNPQEFISLVFDRDHDFQNDPALAELFPIPFPHPQGLNYV